MENIYTKSSLPPKSTKKHHRSLERAPAGQTGASTSGDWKPPSRGLDCATPDVCCKTVKCVCFLVPLRRIPRKRGTESGLSSKYVAYTFLCERKQSLGAKRFPPFVITSKQNQNTKKQKAPRQMHWNFHKYRNGHLIQEGWGIGSHAPRIRIG